ncbi:signal peptidase I [Sphingomonas floccifaciens]|uniref:Signal peptidase I n=1 Tax=Sphingomonas floccifaciens TaxID=1844115 RepID=A0ABW4N955_9SPHN
MRADMAEPTTAPAGTPPAPKPKSELRDTVGFLVKLAIVVFIFRSFFFSPFSIPSQSMLPRLLIGDYLFITKWNYGYSRHSFPWSLPLIPGRVFASTPARGDVVVFKAPPGNREDYIKRVIGLPGDTVQMVGGQLILNGKAVPKQRVADFVVPLSPNYPADTECPAEFQASAAGQPVCRYMQYRETLPNGKTYTVLDRGNFPEADNTAVYTVPAGHIFLMGDNRDASADSRFPASEGGAIGMVPLENVEGKALVTFWSTDGSASWVKPWTWVSAARWNRIGEGF